MKSLNISFELPSTRWHDAQLALPKNSSAPRFSESVIAFVVAAREAIDRRVGKHEIELELGDRLAEMEEVDRRAFPDFLEHLPELLAILGRSH